MSQDERSLFGDEQAYITWKRQQEAEAQAKARADLRKRSSIRRNRKGQFKAIYTSGQRRLMQQFWWHGANKRRKERLQADPELMAKDLQREREYDSKRRHANLNKFAARSRKWRQDHHDEALLREAISRDNRRTERQAYDRAYYQRPEVQARRKARRDAKRQNQAPDAS